MQSLLKRANGTTEEEIFKRHSGDGGYWVPIPPHTSEFRANYHDSLMESTSLSHSLRPEAVIVITCCLSSFYVWGAALPSLTSCTNTGLSPLTVSPKPFSSFWMITHRWTRPASETDRTQRHKSSKRTGKSIKLMWLTHSGISFEISGN